MTRALHRFFASARPDRAEALAALRLVFLAAFGLQAALAALLALVLLWAAGGPSRGGGALAQVILLLSLLQIPLGTALSLGAARPGGKGAALAATILAGVLLGTTAWYAAFALLLGAPPMALALLALLVATGYGLGFGLTLRFAGTAQLPPPERRDRSR